MLVGRVFCLITLGAALAISPAQAQLLKELKGIVRGVGCDGAEKKVAKGLTTCVSSSANTRIWCPNGQVFDREGEKAPDAVVRSVCSLSQVK